MKVNLVTCDGEEQKLLELAERRHDEKIILHVRVRAYLSSARCVIINDATAVTPETVPSQKVRNI